MPGERAPEAVMVQDKGNGHLRLVDPGTGAVLHGLMSMLSEVLDGIDRRLDAMDERIAALVDRPLPEPPPAPELDMAEVRTALDAAVDRVVQRVSEQTAEQIAGLTGELADADERVGRLEQGVVDRLAERLSAMEAAAAERVAAAEAALLERLTHVESALAERVSGLDDAMADGRVEVMQRTAQAEAALANQLGEIGERVDALQPRVDEATGRLLERISQNEQVAAGHLDQFDARVSMQLAEVDAAIAAMRAESAALPANLSEQLQNAIGSWRNRLRRGESDEVSKKAFETLTEQLTQLAGHLADGLARVHEAVNRAQGESLDAAAGTVAELRTAIEGGQSVQLDAVAAVAEKLVAVADEITRRDDDLRQAVDAAQAAIVEAMPEPAAAPDLDGLRASLTEELTRLRESVDDAHARTGTLAATVARQVDEVVQAATAAVGERVRSERTATDGIRRDVELLGTRIEELGKSVSASRRELAVTSQGLPDLVRTAMQENDLGPAIESVKEAVSSANHEHQDVLRALHSSLAKRFDLRARTISESLDSLGAALEAARALGPSLEKVGLRLEQQQPALDQMRTDLVQVASSIEALAPDMDRRHAEAMAGVERVSESLSTLRKHAAALDRAVQAMRASHDGLSAAFIDLRDGSAVVPPRIDQIAGALDAARRQLGEVGELTRTVAGAVDQQQAMGTRLAELVTQVRAATRSDIERVESSIHLEVLKQHQQDQARLTQAVAGVSDVVEREAAVIAQRVSALANDVDAIRLELAAGGSTPRVE